MEAVFSILNTNTSFYENLWKEFLEKYKKLDWDYSLLTFLSFVLSKIYEYDLDAHLIIVGKARTGKSTLALQLLRRIYSFAKNIPRGAIDNYIVNSDYLNKSLLYSDKQKNLILKNVKDVVIVDEGFLTADRRKAMYSLNVEYTEMLNVFANKNNVVITNMQDLTALDTRVIRKATFLIVILERGKAFLYNNNITTPIIKQPSIFEIFEKNPYLLSDKKLAKHTLLSIKNFISVLRWHELKDTNILWSNYQKKKAELQADIFEDKQQPQQQQPQKIDKQQEKIAREKEWEKLTQEEREEKFNEIFNKKLLKKLLTEEENEFWDWLKSKEDITKYIKKS